MIIYDLNFCEAVEFANEIVGATADTNGDAYAKPGFAIADTMALATGSSTYTDANAYTSVVEKKNVTKSKAKIKASAFAIDGNGKDKDKIRDTDVYVLHTK